MGRHGSRERKAWSQAKEPVIEKAFCCSCVHFRFTLVLKLIHKILTTDFNSPSYCYAKSKLGSALGKRASIQ